MMALDGKAIIKEEIPDKDIYESSNNRRNKGNGKDNCRTPDSPESARAIAPRSPMSPQIHHTSLAPPRPNRNRSSSPIVNGATTTPPPATSAITPHLEQTRALSKIRRFLGSLIQFSQDTHPEASERIRALVLSLVSGGITIEEFRITLQEATNFPLRPYVIPFLKSHVPLLQREIAGLARATNQTTLQYVTTNDTCAMEFLSHGPPDHPEIFLPLEITTNPPPPTAVTASAITTNGLLFKRRASDTLGDHHNGSHEWNDYIYPPTKRLSHGHASLISTATGTIFNSNSSQPSLFEYQNSANSGIGGGGGGGGGGSGGGGSMSNHNEGFSVLLDKSSHRDERDIRYGLGASTGGGGSITDNQRISRMSGEEEWKNIHTMLNCISAMVDKTKRAITILQQRGVDPQPSYSSEAAVAEIRRQTEEKVVEFKRNAEDAVNQVKRQAVIEIQRAVAAAESRAADLMAQERLKMEKFFVEMGKHVSIDSEAESKSPSLSTGQNSCWNCGRKANETCTGCNMARYCGAFCQHKDWEHHHQICGNIRADVTAATVAVAAVSKHQSQQSIRNQMVRSPPTPSNQSSQSGGGGGGGGNGGSVVVGNGGSERNNGSGNAGTGGGNGSQLSNVVVANGVNSGGGTK